MLGNVMFCWQLQCGLTWVPAHGNRLYLFSLCLTQKMIDILQIKFESTKSKQSSLHFILNDENLGNFLVDRSGKVLKY